MDLDDIMKNPGKQKFNVDVGIALLRIIETNCTNNLYLQSILKRQLEIQESLKGEIGTGLDESVLERMKEIEESISKFSQEEYHKTLEKVLK